MNTQSRLEAALHSLGWRLDGPRRIASGWKATIERDTVSILLTGPTVEQVLEDLLRCAQERARKGQP